MFCRKFKFPLKSPDAISPVSPGLEGPETISTKTPVSETVPADPQSISAVLSGEPETEDVPTAPSVSGDQPVAERDEPERVASPVETQGTSIIPDSPVSTEPVSEPVTSESVESPQHDHDRPEPSHAHTIDEAIANFKSAVKTPEPETLLPSEDLSAVERDNTLDIEEPSPAKTDADVVAPAVNGNKSDTQSAAPNAERPAPLRHSSDNISATAPRVIAKTPPPPPKEVDTTHDEDEEGVTMEDVDID